MKVAVMQPYFFPYIGYFQLVSAVTSFYFYDDVNYIKGGWINRNSILSNHSPLLFTVPLSDASPNRLISETRINEKLYDRWAGKFLRTLEQSYRKAPHFDAGFQLVSRVVQNRNDDLVSSLAAESVKAVAAHLELEAGFGFTSACFPGTRELKGQERLIEMCREAMASGYINPAGGRSLYDKEAFSKEGISLRFLTSSQKEYLQFKKPFVPSLSIIDVLMFNSPVETRSLLEAYSLS